MKILIAQLATGLMAGTWNYASAVPVFSKLENKYASSNVSREILLKDLQQSIEVPWIQTYIFPDKLGWLLESEVWSAIDLSSFVQLRPGAELKLSPNARAQNFNPTVTNPRWKVIAKKDHWLNIFNSSTNSYAWARNTHLMPETTSWDNFLVLETTNLLKTPAQTASSMCNIKRHTTVTFNSFHGHYALVTACGKTGYIHLNAVITKSHFARKVKTRDGLWHNVNRVNTNEVISSEFMPIAFSEITAFEFDPKIRYSKSNTIILYNRPNKFEYLGTYGFSNPQKLLSQQIHFQKWAQSAIKDMGVFWWNLSDIDKDSSEATKAISSEKLFARKVFDFATHPHYPQKKIASANGIFLTTDGNNWKKIEQFEDQSFPVSISKTGKIFVGPFVSQDGGETFKSFVRWDSLLQSIGASGHFSLSQLKISEVQPMNTEGDHIRFEIYFSGRSVRAETKNFGRTWSQIK